MKRDRVIFEKATLNKIEYPGGRRHVNYSDDVLKDYPEDIQTLIQTVAEQVWRECLKYRSRELKKSKQLMYHYKSMSDMYKHLYTQEIGEDEKIEVTRRKHYDAIEMLDSKREVSYEEYFRLRKQCQKLMKERDTLSAKYSALRKEKNRE